MLDDSSDVFRSLPRSIDRGLIEVLWHTRDVTFRVVLEFDEQAGGFSAVCPELPGCASAGETEEEARLNIIEAIQLYLEPIELKLSENARLIEVVVG